MAFEEEITVRLPVQPEEIRRILQKKREELGLTKTRLAELVTEHLRQKRECSDTLSNSNTDNVTISYKRIADWETGRIKSIPDEIKIALFYILGIDEQKELFKEIKMTVINTTPQMETIKEFTHFADDYIIKNMDNLSKDTCYGRGIKADVRDILEEFFRAKDGLKKSN